MKHLTFLFFVLCAPLCHAQYRPLGAITMWVDGYVVTTQNDTLHGQVRVGSMINNSPATVIIKTADDKKTTLKGTAIQILAQKIPNFAYTTGSIPRSREMVIYDRVPNPRKGEKPTLLERLSPDEGAIALYFDPFGWKKNAEFTFGNFTIATLPKDLSYVVVKNGQEALLAQKSTLSEVHENLFGDCPDFVRQFPVATRRDWNQFGELVAAYNGLCRK